MRKYDEIKYERPDYEKLKEKMNQVAHEIKTASDFDTVLSLLQDFQKEYDRVETMMSIAVIASYLDGTDEEAGEEGAFCMGNSQAFDVSPIYEAIASSPFKEDFDKKYGTFLLESVSKKKMLHGAGEEFLAKEQEILAEISKVVANITFDYNGEKLSASQIGILKESDDPVVKKNARYAYRKAYADNGEKIGEYLGQLIETRDKLAKANGYSNYLEYCNIEKDRYSYGEPEFDEFVKNVKKYILPLSEKSNKKIQKRLNLETYTNDDTGKYFADGNAKPVGDLEFVKDKMQQAFDDMDPMLGDTYRKMRDNGYTDLERSDTKLIGLSFAQQIFSERIPYVFSNYLGDAAAVNTLFHEFGHAMQMQLSMNRYDLHEFYDQVQDLSEVPSKTMELFSLSYAKSVFGDDADKYVEGHLINVLDEFTGYCMFHELETYFYTNVQASPQDRIDKYNELTKLYSPGVTYNNFDLFEKGCGLYSSYAIWRFARYVITYPLCSLASVYLAMEFKKDKKRGAELFKKLGEIGGSMDYNDAIKYMGLKSPFSEEVIREVAEYLQRELEL